MASRVYRPIDILPILSPEFFNEDKQRPVSLPLKEDGLPRNLVWFGAQIAGHKTQLDKNGQQQLGFLKDLLMPECILKPVMNDKRGKREKGFYLDVFSPAAPMALRVFRPLVPEFHRLRDLSFKGTEHELLELEDATEYFRLPAVIDIKIGQKTWGPDADEEKIRKERVKYPAQEVIGFRILGYKVENDEGQVACLERERCLQLAPQDIRGALEEYLSHRAEGRADLIDKILLQLEDVRYAMSQGVYHFYSSSILIAFEAHPDEPADAVVRMIDFSHVFKGKGQPDENYLYGLNALTGHLEAIKDCC